MRRILNLMIMAFFFLCACVAKEKSEESLTQDNNKKNIVHLTKADFLKKVVDYETNSKEWKYLGDKPCIIDFYATWCGPCKRLAPVLEELVQEYGTEIYIYKIDTDKERELAAAFAIQSIPTLLFCPMNEDPQVARGAMSKEELKKIIDEVLLKKTVGAK